MSGGQLLGVSVLEIRTDQSGLDAGLMSAKEKTARTSAEMTTAMDRAGHATSQATLKLKGYQLQVESAQARVNALARAVQSGAGDQQKLNDLFQIAQGRLQLAQGTLAAYEAKTAGSAAATRGLSRETRTLAADTGVSARAMRDLYEQMGPVGRGLGDLTTRTRLYRDHGIDYLAAGIIGLEAGFIGLSVRAAVKFQELGDTIQKQTGLTGRNLDDLLNVIRRVGRDSPYQLSQVADASVMLRQSFHETDKQISTTANLMVAFANSTGQDVRPQMQQLSRIMTDFRVPLGQVVGLTDKLVGVAQATQQPISGLVNSLDRYGPRLQALGLNLDESIRLLGVFTASGINADQMGRGLTSALTAMQKATTVPANAHLRLEEYSLSVKQAQMRVDSLSHELGTTWVGNQGKVNAELQIAQGRLDIAKQKYDALNTTLKVASKAHGDNAVVINQEIKAIVDAHSKQDALNVAVGLFGKSLGPQMARAFYNNQAALDKVDKALHKTKETQHLFMVDAHSLPGELRRAKNNFQDLEIAVGNKLVPALSHAVDWLRSTVHGIEDFTKHHKDLVEIAGAVTGIGSALTLLSRHTPLGNLLGRLFADAGHTTLASILSGGKSGAMFGVRGPAAPGSLANPVAVTTEGGFGGGGGPGASTAEKDAIKAAERDAGAGAGGAGLLKTLGEMPLWQKGAAVAAGAATPFLTADLFRAILGRYAHPLDTPAARENRRLYEVGPNGQLVSRGGVNVGPTQAGAPGGAPFIRQTANARTATADFKAMNDQLVKLELGRQSVQKTARALDQLAVHAHKAGDVKWQIADRLGAEMLRTRSVNSKGVQSILADMGKLAPGARAAASMAMTDMSQELETAGKVPQGTTVRLVNNMLASYKSMRDKGGTYFKGLMTDTSQTMKILEQKIATSTGKQKTQALAQYHLLQAGVKSAFGSMESNISSQASKMAGDVAKGSAAAYSAGTTNWNKLAGNIKIAVDAGVLTVQQGDQIIASSLNSILKGFGEAPLSVAQIKGLTPAQRLAVASGAVSSGAAASPHAAGGLVQIGRPGERGPDNVPLNVAGTPIRVGRGEKVAVFNHDQQHELDMGARARGYTGLDDMFRRVNRPHYMATGGFVPISAPSVAGGAEIGREAQGALNLAAKAAAKYERAHMPAPVAGCPGLAGAPQLIGRPGVDKMIREADSIAAHNYSYLWGGGHQALGVGPYDCSGAVSAVLGADGLVRAPEDAQQYMSFGDQGPGKWITIYASPSHVFMSLLGHYFGTSGQNPGGGANWIPTFPESMPAVRHPHGFAKGGVVDLNDLPPEILNQIPAMMREAERRRHRANRFAILPGLATGGFVVTGPVSTFGPPGEAAGTTAFGRSSADPGLSLRIGATAFDDPRNRALMGHWFDVQIAGHRATLEDIDLGPNPSTGRNIDVTGAGVARLGIPYNTFPTGAHGVATEVSGPGATTPSSRGGSSGSSSTSSHIGKLKKVKKTPKHPTRRTALPKLKGIPGFPADKQLTELLDTTALTELQGWQSYLTSKNSAGAPLEALVTLADGSQVINWGKEGGPSPSGMIDPSTGQITKGIWDRLAEIGDPGSNPNQTATRDQNTELGIEEQILDEYLREQALAMQVDQQLGPWMDQVQISQALADKQVAWLKQALDLSQPMPKIEALFKDLGDITITRKTGGAWGGWLKGKRSKPGTMKVKVPVSRTLLEKVRVYRNAQAQINRWTRLKQKLPQEKQLRDAAITTRFATERHKIENASATSTFDGQQLLSAQLKGLDAEKKAALLPAGNPPHDWTGDKASWDAERTAENADITSEFDARAAALRDAAKKAGLGARLAKSNALFSLTQQEAADKLAVSQQFSTESHSYTDKITGERQTAASDKKWVSDLLTAIKASDTTAKGQITTGQANQLTLKDYLDPMGTLSINILTAQTVDAEPNIPGYLTEISNLKGTTVPLSSTSADGGVDSQLAPLLQQVATTLAQEYAVSQAQYKVLQALPPFGGSFALGGIVPGALGEPRTIIAHGGEEISQAGSRAGQGHTFHVIVQDGAVDANRIKVIANGEAQKVTRKIARAAGVGLPGRGGGLQLARR